MQLPSNVITPGFPGIDLMEKKLQVIMNEQNWSE